MNATLDDDSSGAMVLLISYRFPHSQPSIMVSPSGFDSDVPVALCDLHSLTIHVAFGHEVVARIRAVAHI